MSLFIFFALGAYIEMVVQVILTQADKRLNKRNVDINDRLVPYLQSSLGELTYRLETVASPWAVARMGWLWKHVCPQNTVDAK